MIVIPVFLVAGIIQLIAENMNYNIPPNKDPNMDIRVRREIKFDMNHPEEVDTPPDKNEQVSIIEVLRRHKFEQDIRPKRDAYSDVYPYETNIKYNNGILNNGTAKSESIIKTGYQLLMAAIFKPSKKKVSKLNTTHYHDGNYYNNGYEKQNNGNYNQANSNTGTLPNENYNAIYGFNGYNNKSWSTGVYNTPLYNGNRNLSHPYNQNYPYNDTPHNSYVYFNHTYYTPYKRNYNPNTQHNGNYNPQNTYNGNNNTHTQYNGSYSSPYPYNGNYNTATNNGYYTTASSNNGNPPYNGATVTTYNGNFKTVTPYNGYSPYKNGSYNNGVPNHGNSQSNGTSKTNGTTATTTEKPNIAQACIIMCNTFNCPKNYTQMGFGCVPDSDYE